MIRKPQTTADVVIGFTLVNSSGGNASGEELNITAIITGPTGAAVTGFTPPTITETGHAGNYIAVFPATAANKAFTTADAGNPYHVSFDSSTSGIDPTGIIEVEISAASLLAVQAKTDNLPASPAAVGSAMTLTAAYDPAKTAATQTSVNSIAADIAGLGGGTGGGSTALVSVAATQTITASSSMTGGEVALNIGGVAVTFPVLDPDAANIPTVMAAYINASATVPVTATASTGSVLLTAKTAGAAGNDITVIVTTNTTGSAIAATGATLTGGADGLFDEPLPESYAADGSEPSMIQILYMLYALMAQKALSGTTLTAKKLDGTTTAMTFTLDSATAPTSITRTA